MKLSAFLATVYFYSQASAASGSHSFDDAVSYPTRGDAVIDIGNDGRPPPDSANIERGDGQEFEEIEDVPGPNTKGFSLEQLVVVLKEGNMKNWEKQCKSILEHSGDEDELVSQRVREAVVALYQAMKAYSYSGVTDSKKAVHLYRAAEQLRKASIHVQSDELKQDITVILQIVTNQEAANSKAILEEALEIAKRANMRPGGKIDKHAAQRVIGMMSQIESEDPELIQEIQASMTDLERLSHMPNSPQVQQSIELSIAQLREMIKMTSGAAKETILNAVNALEKFEVKRSFFAMFAPDSRQAVLIYISIFLTMANIAVGTTFGLIENSNALVVDAMFGLAAVIRDFGLLAMLKMYRNQVKDGHHPMHIIGIDSKMGLIGSVLVFGVFLHMFMSIGLELPHLTPEGDPLMVIVGTSTGLVLNLSQMFIALLLSTDSGLKDMRYLKEVKGENGETSLQLGAADSGESKKSFAVISQMLTIASECLGNLPPLISGFISMYGTPELGARVDAGLAMLLIVGLSVLMFKESIIPAFLNEGANVADSNALNWFVNSLHEKYGLPSYQIVETHDSGKTVVCILIPKGRYDVAPLPSEQIGNANPGFFARLGQKAREMLWNGKSGAAENAETEPLLVSDEPAPIDESDFEYEAKGPIKDLNLDEMRSIRNDGLEVGITVTFKSIEQANAQQLGPDRIASAAFSRLSKPPSFGRHGI